MTDLAYFTRDPIEDSRLRYTALADQLQRLDAAEANPPHGMKGNALAEWKKAIDERRATLKQLLEKEKAK